jgi:hypothetical protein
MVQSCVTEHCVLEKESAMRTSPRAVSVLVFMSEACLIISLVLVIVALQAFSKISKMYYELQSGNLTLTKISAQEIEVGGGGDGGGAITISPIRIIMYEHNQQTNHWDQRTVLSPGQIHVINADGSSYISLNGRGECPIIEFMNGNEEMQSNIVLNEDNLRFLFTHNNSPGGWEIESDLANLVNP